MLMAVEHQVGVRGVQVVPQDLSAGEVHRAVGGPGVILRLVPDGERALLRIGSQIALQPLLLHRAGRDRHELVVVVQHDDVPISQLVAVVALVARADQISVVVERRSRVAGVVLVIPQRRAGAGLVPPPRGVVAVGVISRGTVGIGVVPGREDGTRNRVEDLRGQLVAIGVARRDVAGADEHDRRSELLDRHGERVRARGPGGVGDGDAHRVPAEARVAVAHDERVLRGDAAVGLGAVAPGDRIRPWSVDPGIVEVDRDVHGLAHVRGQVRSRIHGRREVLHGRRGCGRGACDALRVGHRERDGVGAVRGVGVGRLCARSGGAVTEIPGVGQRGVPLRIG